jgi:hypothetical protein
MFCKLPNETFQFTALCDIIASGTQKLGVSYPWIDVFAGDPALIFAQAHCLGAASREGRGVAKTSKFSRHLWNGNTSNNNFS